MRRIKVINTKTKKSFLYQIHQQIEEFLTQNLKHNNETDYIKSEYTIIIDIISEE